MELLSEVVGDSGIRRLFSLQLQSLREYYGSHYESVLDESSDLLFFDNGVDSSDMKSRKEKYDSTISDAAERAVEGFRAAAINAIPLSCKQKGELEDIDGGYSYVTILNGLISDMMEATSIRQSMVDEWDEANNNLDDVSESEDGLEHTKNIRRGPAKWYEKLLARSLAFGVNYLQGWLAVQAIRKAAADRDKNMPKFPLF
mmetsp:Transcript_9384/g.13318  ORF Transcript_9384/g.13318 Transcript_9384/m.13318 type:complete len:201 (+) Transcript_9384:549-1151(+)